MTPPTAHFAPLTGPLGFYPVVPDAAWVQRLLGWGVRTIQLRIKAADHTPADIGREVNAAIEAGQQVPGAQVFINDHWQLALAAGAYGVHLGQEDLDTADIDALRRAGLRLGLSTHTPAELARARAVQPSYLAIGPIYPTTLKVMPYEPVGLERLALWVPQAAPCPVVAIGGISLERMPGVMACGVEGVAVVSAVTLAADPQQAVASGLTLAARCVESRQTPQDRLRR
ncbi:Thiamin-phosphate pyrophosphorylase [Polaromonas sp. CG9_12]|uniref:thiamine phosphate synthase n=1 Tax=Polaromonas sp. CG_9.11 TaxID=2787730 RepID=UPI0004DDCB84|nr:thiamine phosphate synthase [Polaromonas sp. CG_9.11]MBG6077580.1 thiamine-phosphate diphosphorylase [Polaromonas sp. CG_9.11]CDS52843.1 Thiamin-phosphate pyrophosphorylase [Polaromonas sp. CG9_12]